jgi:hypothetical protein
MPVNVSVGKPTGGVTGVEIGKPTGIAGVSVGPIKIDPPNPQGGPQSVSFNEFYRAINGDRGKAEQMIPGITKPDGYKLLHAGPDGRPHVKVPAQHMPFLQIKDPAQAQAQSQVLDKIRQTGRTQHEVLDLMSKARAATGEGGAGPGTSAEPEWIPMDTLAQQYGRKDHTQLDAGLIDALYPDFTKAAQEAQVANWMRRDVTGAPMFRNPRNPSYRQTKLDYLKSASEAEVRRNELEAQPFDPSQDPHTNGGKMPAPPKTSPIKPAQVIAEDNTANE